MVAKGGDGLVRAGFAADRVDMRGFVERNVGIAGMGMKIGEGGHWRKEKEGKEGKEGKGRKKRKRRKGISWIPKKNNKNNKKEKKEMCSLPLIEKYRPRHFDDIVLDPCNRRLFAQIVDTGYFPNMMFYGPPGTGKTTTILNLIRAFQEKWSVRAAATGENVIHLNASDERGIDVIRLQIQQFVRSQHLFNKGYKFVILDEADYMTKTAQQALKTLLQGVRAEVRFCLICNYISKMDPWLADECMTFRFNQLPRDDIQRLLQRVSHEEGWSTSITDDTVVLLESMYQSDIRSMLNYLQLNSHTKVRKEIPTKEHWDTWYRKMTQQEDDAVDYVESLSRRMNIDVRSLLFNYVDALVRQQQVSANMLEKMERLLHAPYDTPVLLLLNALVHVHRDASLA